GKEGAGRPERSAQERERPRPGAALGEIHGRRDPGGPVTRGDGRGQDALVERLAVSLGGGVEAPLRGTERGQGSAPARGGPGDARGVAGCQGGEDLAGAWADRADRGRLRGGRGGGGRGRDGKPWRDRAPRPHAPPLGLGRARA